jgi:hypothetical protein
MKWATSCASMTPNVPSRIHHEVMIDPVRRHRVPEASGRARDALDRAFAP